MITEMNDIRYITGDSFRAREWNISIFIRNIICRCLVGLFLITCPSLYALVTGFVDDFDDGELTNWWYDSKTYTLTSDKRTRILKIDYHKTESSGKWDLFMVTPSDPIDISDFPFISVKAKSDVTTLLSFESEYHGKIDNQLQAILPDDNSVHTYVFEIKDALDTPINEIFIRFDKGSDVPNSGTIFFDDLRVGDQVIIEINTSELQKWIQCATTLYESSGEGIEVGQYLAGSRAILKSAIDSAQETFDSEAATQQQIDMAISDLVEAGTAFQAGVVTRDVPPVKINQQTGGAALTFGIPTKVPNVNTIDTGELDPHISADGLELYFRGDYPGFNWDLFVATRPTMHHPWGQRQRLIGVNTAHHVEGPCTSSDGLTLYFSGASGIGEDYIPKNTHWADQYDIWTLRC